MNVRAAMNALRLAAACGSLFRASGAGADTFSGNSEYLLEAWQAADGLPQNTVTGSTQTRDGYQP